MSALSNIVWVGFHQEGLLAFKQALKKGYNISLFITLNERELEKRCAAADYLSICQAYKIPFLKVDHINEQDTISRIKELNVDILIVLGWSQIISADILALPRYGVVGAHASLLPHNRGSAPVNWAIIRGEILSGNTLMWLNKGVDTGVVIDQRSFTISEYDTCGTIYQKVAETNREMILDLLRKLGNGVRPSSPQAYSDEEILPRRRPKDGLINWNGSSQEIYNFIRALTRPYPGAFSYIDGKKMFIWNCTKLPPTLNNNGLQKGTILGASKSPIPESCGQVVVCGEGVVVLNEIQFEEEVTCKGFQLSDLDLGGKLFES